MKESCVEYAALTTGAGFSRLGRTLIVVTGVDRAQILQSFTTNDIKKLAAGSGCEAFVTNPQGKTLGHVFVFCEPSQFVLDTTVGQAEALIGHLERYVITEDVQFSDQTAQFCDILVTGAKAESLLRSLSGIDVPTEVLAHARATIAERAVSIRRVEFAGPAAFFVQTAVDDTAAVCERLAASGAVACGDDAVEATRLEAGTPLYGRDISIDNLPQEVNRDSRAISFTKGCYLGQETVARIDAVGHVNRLLVGVKFAGQEVPAAGTSL